MKEESKANEHVNRLLFEDKIEYKQKNNVYNVFVRI